MIRSRRNGNFLLDHCNVSIIVLSFLGAWVVCVPYEGQFLYTLAEYFHVDSYPWLTGSLVMQIVGLLTGGLLIRTMEASKRILLGAIPFCILCTSAFFFTSYWVAAIALLACSAAAGVCIAACGYFFRVCTPSGQRFSVAVDIIIIISVLKLLVNALVLYVSAYAGAVLLIVVLGTAWYFSFRLPQKQKDEVLRVPYNRKRFAQALMLLCFFIVVSSIDFGISIQTVMPTYEHIGWLASWYWLLPYVGAALVMKRIKVPVERNSMLYIALGMIGLAFILFLVLDYSISSYLIIFTLMMGAWAIFDVFWWSMLGEMLNMHKNAALILGLGFSANALGVLHGKMIGKSQLMLTGVETTLISLALICVTLVILPILHRSFSKLLMSGKSDMPVAQPMESGINVFSAMDDADMLTERERQIVALLLKGRTYKLIAAELYLSENTVKTHVKNIYAKLNVSSRAELFNKFDPSYTAAGK